eukprot:319882-Rhodomonas_salina.1
MSLQLSKGHIKRLFKTCRVVSSAPSTREGSHRASVGRGEGARLLGARTNGHVSWGGWARLLGRMKGRVCWGG